MSSLGLNLNSTTATQGNGIDVTAVVDQILFAARAPERLWQAQQSALAAQASALSSINSSLNSLVGNVNNLKDSLGALSAKLATSSQPSILTANVSSSAEAGLHSIKVTNLASISSYYSDPVLAGTLADGSFSIQVGSGSAQTVTISDGNGNKTLDSLASYINNTSSFGVTASVITDANGPRLALVSKTSGQAGDLTITGSTADLSFNKSVTGINATLSVDGVPISSATNTVTGALPGVTLNLASAAPGTEVLLTVASDTAGTERAVNDFVANYNSVITAINAQFAADPSTGAAGPLAGNGSLRSPAG